MATGSMSGIASLRVGSEIAPEVATELGAARQWSGDALRPGALSGHSPHGGFPLSGQQSPCCVAAAQVIAGTATLNSENQTINSLARRLLNLHSAELPHDRFPLSQMLPGNANYRFQPCNPGHVPYLSGRRKTLTWIRNTANVVIAR
jgi:hypothetical protein